MIIETTDNRFYRVRELKDPDLAHVWEGVRVKHCKEGNGWAEVATRTCLVRKEASRVVEA
jgi:hypothetical protein